MDNKDLPPLQGGNWLVIAQPPTLLQRTANIILKRVSNISAWLSALLVVFILLRITAKALPAMSQYGIKFLTETTWDPLTENYGILPEIWGTLYTSFLALIAGSFFGVAAAIFLSEGFLGQAIFVVLKIFKIETCPVFSKLPEQLDGLLRNLIELLAAIPSVVYGLWGIFVLIPAIRPVCNWFNSKLGWVVFFGTPLSGPGVLPAVIVLSIMILPTITAISRDALEAVPPKLRMAAYGIGATRWETILAVIIPVATRGIAGAVILAFGRALGETMALAMLVGNSNSLSLSLFSPANTLASLLANNFPEAGHREVSVLMYAALVLLAITLFVNVIGALILQKASRAAAGGR
ncbi:MAG: phosphate ABC transporter permease subunit PstC [Nitrospirae bacterium]|nr:phosphate ABC transporter permease subunit PstC [Nitrospirota bacterium]MBF0535454.1 phosphate ABC transporter permease subunit PstC [Nitrospirota bacterium]MBF0617642.1 phosphate ABC transporter permease subunit PstC [Nitrospirota bacterium]